jgi:hypothetical protein
MKDFNIHIEFKLEDMWVGVYWKSKYKASNLTRHIDIWVCLLPCLPIHISYYKDLLE